jgi:cytochrome c peroxidase
VTNSSRAAARARRCRSLAGTLVGAAVLASAAAHAEAVAPAGSQAQRDAYRRRADVVHPEHNRATPEREQLGKLLFFDPRLSRSGVMSCATCHNPALAWGDGLALGVGHGMKTLARRTPTLLNVAWAELFFWDGRAASLEEQALGPIASPDEMNLPLGELTARIAAIPEYRRLFERAYPEEPIAAQTIAKAIAAYERTIVSGEAPFDRWAAGNEQAVSEAAKRGFELFDGKAQCSLCHAGWRFTDDAFHDVGVPGEDRGRGKHLPQIGIVQFAFKTPTLRNVDRRAPYMHDGSEPTLEAVVELYDLGGRAKRPSLAPEMKPLGLSAREKSDLVAFLKTLTSVDAPVELPLLPR